MLNNRGQIRKIWFPTQGIARLLAVGHQHGGITGAAGLNVGGNAPVGNAPGGINDFLHRKALTVAQIKGIAFPVGCKTAPSVSSFDQKSASRLFTFDQIKNLMFML